MRREHLLMNRRLVLKAPGVDLRLCPHLRPVPHRVVQDRRVWDLSRTQYEDPVDHPLHQLEGPVRARWDLYRQLLWAGKMSLSRLVLGLLRLMVCILILGTKELGYMNRLRNFRIMAVRRCPQARPTAACIQEAPFIARHNVSRAIAEFVKEGARVVLRVAPQSRVITHGHMTWRQSLPNLQIWN